MTTSFYFVMWIGIYLLIDVFGGRTMQEYAFFIALVAVFAISGILNRLLKGPVQRMNERKALAYMELIYTNDIATIRKQMLYHAIFCTASAVYMVFTTVFLLAVGEWVIAVVFGFLGYGFIRSSIGGWQDYMEIRDSDRIPVPDDEYFITSLNNYAAARSNATLAELMPRETASDTALRIFNIVVAALSILIGAYFFFAYVPLLFIGGLATVGVTLFLFYGGLALIYGITDLISAISNYNPAAR